MSMITVIINRQNNIDFSSDYKRTTVKSTVYLNIPEEYDGIELLLIPIGRVEDIESLDADKDYYYVPSAETFKKTPKYIKYVDGICVSVPIEYIGVKFMLVPINEDIHILVDCNSHTLKTVNNNGTDYTVFVSSKMAHKDLCIIPFTDLSLLGIDEDGIKTYLLGADRIFNVKDCSEKIYLSNQEVPEDCFIIEEPY